ncbi:dual specificity protein phosphatase family protein [Azospirillum sp.]|uniref:phosphatase domain-containing putative toxin n=1 Tax=Azospirillum sp. TaxID=34012 RepID=UPI00261D8CBE|nr:dual specificity protein phosphatase family protein [Azospirillum sp.]
MTSIASVRAKTSLEHPLEIKEIITRGGGVLGLAMCPGRKDRDPVTGGWNRDIFMDVETIRAWGARSVLCLLERDEMRRLGVLDLGDMVRCSGMEFHSAPINDMHAPGPAFESVWEGCGKVVRNHLSSGQRVVIHCRAGQGRSGMIAARLLVELGMAADEAIAAIQYARPGVLSAFSDQEAHVRSLRPSTHHQHGGSA